MIVEKDLKTSFIYFKFAADQNHAKAQYNLGLCFEKGLGTIENRDFALEYYKLAQDQGVILAEKALKRLNNDLLELS